MIMKFTSAYMKSIMGEFWVPYRIEWELFLVCRL